MLETQLCRVINVLVLAAAAHAEVAAFRRGALWRCCDDVQQSGARKILLHLRDFRLNGFAGDDEWYEHDQFIHAPDPFAAERDIVNRQINFIARFE